MCSSIGLVGEGALAYIKSDKPVPDELGHNIRNVYEAHRPYINPNSWLFQNTTMPESFGGKDDWLLDATICNSGYAYMAYLFPDYLSLYQNLLHHEFYTRNDYLSFPVNAQAYCQAIGREYFWDERWFINSVNAFRHLVAYLWLDDSINFQLTLPTSTPTSAPTSTPTRTPTPTPIRTPTPTSPPTATSTPDPVCQYNYVSPNSLGAEDLLHVLANWNSSSITKLLAILANWGRSCGN